MANSKCDTIVCLWVGGQNDARSCAWVELNGRKYTVKVAEHGVPFTEIEASDEGDARIIYGEQIGRIKAARAANRQGTPS